MTFQLEVGKRYQRADGECLEIASEMHIPGAIAPIFLAMPYGDVYHRNGSPRLNGVLPIVAEWSGDSQVDARVRCNQGEHSLVETGGRRTWCRVCDLGFELIDWAWVPAS